MTTERKIGICISLASLRNPGNAGIGDMGDLCPLVDLADALGIGKIYLQRVVDTGFKMPDGSLAGDGWQRPLRPTMLDLRSFSGGFNRIKSAEYSAKAAELDSMPEVDYAKVRNAKIHFMREQYLHDGASTLGSEAYHTFWKNNRSWLEPYSVYCTLRHKYGTGDSRFWSEPDYRLLLEDPSFIREYSDDIRFHLYLQFLTHSQMQQALEYADGKGIIIEAADDRECPSLSRNEDGILEGWVVEELIKARIQQTPETATPVFPLSDFLDITTLGREAFPQTGIFTRMGMTLEAILRHKALLGQIRRIL